MIQRKSLISHVTKRAESSVHSQAYDFKWITTWIQSAFASAWFFAGYHHFSQFFMAFLSRKGVDFSWVTRKTRDKRFHTARKKIADCPKGMDDGTNVQATDFTDGTEWGSRMVVEVDSDGMAWEKSKASRISDIIYMNRVAIIALLTLSLLLTGCAAPDVKLSDMTTTTATISNNAVTIHLGSDNLCSECSIRAKAKVVDQTVYVVGHRTLRERNREFVVKLPASLNSQSVNVIWVNPDGNNVPIPITN